MKIAIIGDVATQLLVRGLDAALRERGVAAELWEAPWGQVVRQLTCADSELARFAPDVVVVWESVEHWWERGETAAERLESVEKLATAFSGRIYCCNAAPFDDGLGFAREVRAFNAALDRLEAEHLNFQVVDLAELMARKGRENAFDGTVFALADMALVPELQTLLARRLAVSIAADAGKVRKCVVTDCDGTLWGGIAAELGPDGVEYGDTPQGRSHARYQQWLKRLQRQGVLLAIDSKNEPETVDAVFAARPEMALKRDDFVACQVNWNPKPANLDAIAKQLNLALDAFVFLDDREEQRREMRAVHPEVCVPELPPDPAEWVEFLAAQDIFPSVRRTTPEDQMRTAMYREAQAREAAKAEYVDEAAYLASLESEMSAVPVDGARLARVVQLIQRTNQFNLRTQRHSEAEVLRMAAGEGNVALAFKLKDRFGDFGLVSVLLAERRDESTLFIDTWVMSCRVIGRGLERFAMDELVRTAKDKGVSRIVGEYLSTPRNALVKDLYNQLGFAKMEDGTWLLQI